MYLVEALALAPLSTCIPVSKKFFTKWKTGILEKIFNKNGHAICLAYAICGLNNFIFQFRLMLTVNKSMIQQ